MGDLVAAGQIDPSEGLIELKVNGAVRQPFDLSNMIWNVPETLAYLSRLVSSAGDLIMTGTSEGSAPAVRTGTTLLQLALVDPVRSQRRNVMSPKIDKKSQKIHNPHGEFDKPGDVVKDTILSQPEKKKALENLEQDAHQLMTASNEGMAPENDRVAEHEPQLDEVVKAQQGLGEKPKNKPTQ
jgi:2-keto-4-pentenoate hydratase/2-oxohepta-3-ene-1,7-dioic acid hydratase in catechol pathway